MGRKRTGKGKHLLCIFAGLIVSIALGCATVVEVDRPAADRLAADRLAADRLAADRLAADRLVVDLKNAADLYARGDFESSLRINQGVASQCDHKVPGDQALFNMGLILASQNYSRKDYTRSRAMFQRVIKEYPESPLVAQSRTWIGVLSVIERSKEADIEVEQTRKKLAR